MTQLLDVRKIKKVKLLSFPEVEIEMYDGLLTSQVGLMGKTMDDYDRGIDVLRFLIKSWSFVNEKEEPLVISKENLGKLPAKDFTFLMKEATDSLDFLGEEKQKS